MGGGRPAVVFDGDDTLWKTQELYAAATSEFYQLLEAMGFDGSRVRSLFRSYNRPVPGKGQRPKERRNRAVTETYATLCRESGCAFDRQVVKEIVKTNERIYAVDPRPMENAQEALSRLAERAKVVLFSGGDDEVQRRKLTKVSLASYFDERIYVVPEKSKGALRHVLKEERLDPRETWMVGNSPRFDINPALELGLNCIWLHTGFWREDMDEFAALPTFVAFTLDEVLATVTQGTPHGDGDYVAPQKGQAEIRQWLEERALRPEGAYLVGTSLKYDVNPGLDLGMRCIWLYAPPKGQEREPSLSKVFIAFSTGRVDEILSSHSKEEASLDVLWSVRASDREREPEVND